MLKVARGMEASLFAAVDTERDAWQIAQNYLIACLARCSKERGGSGSALFSSIAKFLLVKVRMY